MRTIVVDDEAWMLKRFLMECEHIEDVEILGSFRSPGKALEFAAANRIELAFLDMEMPEMNGLQLAGKLRDIIPEIIIIFVSAYDSYMPEAFRTKKADYYVMKPYTTADIEDAVSRAKLLSGRLRKNVFARTFGSFELLVDDSPFNFEDADCQQLLALLVDRNGTLLTPEEICDALWSKTQITAQDKLDCRRLFQKLRQTLKTVHLDEAVGEEDQRYFLHAEVLDCDLYRFMEGKLDDVRAFTGTYMEGYAWAAARCAELRHQQEEFLRQNPTRDDTGFSSPDPAMQAARMEAEYNSLQQKCAALRERCNILHKSEELYRTALGLTSHTVTLVDIPKHALCQIFNEGTWSGVETTMEDAPESIIKNGIIYPDDVENYREFYRQIYAGEPKCECSMRVLSENGHWFWFTMYTQTIYDEQGTPLYAVCFSDDLTSRREAEMMYKQFVDIIISGAQYSWMVNLTTDTIERQAADLYKIVETGNYTSFTELNEATLNQSVPEDRERMRKTFDRLNMMQAYYDGEREIRAECRYLLPGSSAPIWMESITYLMKEVNGDIYAIMTMRNIDNLKREENALESKVENDPLCGISRRDNFNRLVQEALDSDETGSLFMIDVDNFKQVNDTYGHLFGDEVLVAVAEAIKGNFRATDYVARYGGDEFVVFMVGRYSPLVLEAAAKSLLNRIHKITFDNGYAASISIGVAQCKGEARIESLYKRADAALYESKEKGRNTYTIG